MFCSRAVCLAVTLLPALSHPSLSDAQMTRGSVAGNVRDASGAVVPGAVVTVTNVDTSASRTARSDGRGFYRVAALEPGWYTARIELPGFRTVEQRRLQVRAAMETPADVRLEPAGLSQTIQVTWELPNATLNRTNPAIATTITSRVIAELPLSGGRNLNDLVLTVPNAVATTGQGTYAVNGNRPRNNNYMVDGSDNNDIMAAISASQLAPEAVAEFQVIQNPYSAEFGRNSGGQVNVITRSGANRFAGDFFDYYQSAGLNSRTNLEKANSLATPAKLVRHQLGGDLGGPILPARVFFFGLYQRDSQQPAERPSPAAIRIPTQAGYLALQQVPLRAGQPAASRQAVLRQIGFLQDLYRQNPVFRSLTETLVNGVRIETGQTRLPIHDPSRYHTWLGRGDYRARASDAFTVRYSLNHRVDTHAVSNLAFGPLFAGSQTLRDTNLAISHAHIRSPRVLNEWRLSFIRRALDFPENDPASPTATISGLFSLGGAGNFPQGRLSSAYQFSDALTWAVEGRTLKVGADVRYNDISNLAAFNAKGTFAFDNLEAYLNNHASQVQQALQTSSWAARQWQSFFFVQHDLRLTSALTLSLGLRYEISDVPLGLFGAADARSSGALVPGPARRDTNNLAPRAGFACSPRTRNWLLGDRRSVVRGGVGVGYDVLFHNLLAANASNYPRVVTLTADNVFDLYPNRLQGSAAPTFNPLGTWVNSSEDIGNPESRFYSLTLQREVGSSLFEVGYSGSRGFKGLNQIERNPAVLTGEQAAAVRAGGTVPSIQARRVIPAIGSRVMIPAYRGPAFNDVEARSTYDAVFASANRRLSRGLMMTMSYTFSRWMSNNDAPLGEGGTPQSSQRPQSMFDYHAEWSRSQFDRPHRLAVTYLWVIPAPRTGILGQVIGGWQLSGMTAGQSGQPFTILTGVDSSGDGNTGSDRPDIDMAGSLQWDRERKTFRNNGYYVVPLGANNLPLANSLGNGSAPRNSERGAPYWNTNLSLMKRVSLPGAVECRVRLDAFNVFNQDNYGAPDNNMSSPGFGTNMNNFGRRILQLGGKFMF